MIPGLKVLVEERTELTRVTVVTVSGPLKQLYSISRFLRLCLTTNDMDGKSLEPRTGPAEDYIL